MSTDAPVTLITGAGSGIGRATALSLASRGHRLVLAGRRRAPLDAVEADARAAGAPETLVQPTDMGDATAVGRLARATLERFSRLDGLVNNAGLAELASIPDTDLALLERTFAVNAIGPSLLVSALWARLIERGARIVNVTSYATIDPFPGFFAYAQAKGAAMLQVRAIHNEGHADGVLAFGVAPGAVETPMLRGLFDESVIGKDSTLDPAAVAEVIVACATGERDGESGETIAMPNG